MTEPVTHTLAVPGATLTYDVREGRGDQPALLLIGSPMGAAGFATLAGHFTERTLVTYDPRGVERSVRTDGASETRVEEHADDLHRVIAAVSERPVDLFASSGGAVNALALVARHPDQVRTLVAHEPPAARLLPDREEALAASRDTRQAYDRGGLGPGMAAFIALVGHKGPIPAEFVAQAAPDPAMFGLPTEDDGDRDDVLIAQNLISCTHHEHDLEALRAVSTRIVPVVGAESEGEMAHRAGVALAERLDLELVVFPSHHGGFCGGEYGQQGDPDAFAAALRGVLTSQTSTRPSVIS